MKNKQTYLARASMALLIFVMLGYLVKFYPETLAGMDTSIQSTIRGNLPAGLTRFFQTITVLGNTAVQVVLVAVIALFSYLKKWYMEAVFALVNGVLAGFFILTLKHIYQRPRPSITHLVHADGYSFPSGHSMGSMLIIGTVMVIVHQRLKKGAARLTLEICLAAVIAMIILSRVYLGVHYPSDVFAGAVLGFGVISLTYPFYDQKRFEWRFQSKQK